MRKKSSCVFGGNQFEGVSITGAGLPQRALPAPSGPNWEGRGNCKLRGSSDPARRAPGAFQTERPWRVAGVILTTLGRMHVWKMFVADDAGVLPRWVSLSIGADTDTDVDDLLLIEIKRATHNAVCLGAKDVLKSRIVFGKAHHSGLHVIITHIEDRECSLRGALGYLTG